MQKSQPSNVGLPLPAEPSGDKFATMHFFPCLGSLANATVLLSRRYQSFSPVSRTKGSRKAKGMAFASAGCRQLAFERGSNCTPKSAFKEMPTGCGSHVSLLLRQEAAERPGWSTDLFTPWSSWDYWSTSLPDRNRKMQPKHWLGHWWDPSTHW